MQGKGGKEKEKRGERVTSVLAFSLSLQQFCAQGKRGRTNSKGTATLVKGKKGEKKKERERKGRSLPPFLFLFPLC